MHQNDFESKNLEDLSDAQLEQRFCDLVDKLVDPLMGSAISDASPSIERARLLRIGFSGTEAKSIVRRVVEYGLLGKGAGHVVYLLAKTRNLSIREAGLQLAGDKGGEEIQSLFGVSIRKT